MYQYTLFVAGVFFAAFAHNGELENERKKCPAVATTSVHAFPNDSKVQEGIQYPGLSEDPISRNAWAIELFPTMEVKGKVPAELVTIRDGIGVEELDASLERFILKSTTLGFTGQGTTTRVYLLSGNCVLAAEFRFGRGLDVVILNENVPQDTLDLLFRE